MGRDLPVEEEKEKTLKMVKKAFILVADGSEEIEFVTVYDGMTGCVFCGFCLVSFR